MSVSFFDIDWDYSSCMRNSCRKLVSGEELHEVLIDSRYDAEREERERIEGDLAILEAERESKSKQTTEQIRILQAEKARMSARI